MDEVDVSYLRDRLRDYYGTAMVSEFPMAMAELNDVDSMSDEEVIEKAEDLGWVSHIRGGGL